MDDVTLARTTGQAHELERGRMHVTDAAEQMLAGADGSGKRTVLLGKSHK